MSSKNDFYCGSCNRRKALDLLAWSRSGVNSCKECDSRRKAAQQRIKKQGFTG